MIGLPLRVGIDGFNLAMPHGTGVATYGRTLAQACRQLGRRIDLVYGLDVPPGSTPEQRETLFFAALNEGRPAAEGPVRRTPWQQVRRAALSPRTRHLVEIPMSGRVIQKGMAERVPAFDRLFTLNRLFHVGAHYLRRYGRLLPVRVPDPPAIMHWTYPVPVRMVGSRNVYTVHDLIPLRLPYLSLEDKRYHERLLRRCIVEGSHILTVSEVSRTDILTYLPVDPERVTNTWQALPERSARAIPVGEQAARLRAWFDLEPQGYLLFFGAIEPKKNVARLIEAYLAASVDLPLVIVGPDAWGSQNELRLLAGTLGRAQRIRRIGYLPAEHLDLLVRAARAVAFPSLYEGFGLPALEAMAAGVPVIAGQGGALPEIVGGAGLMVDPYDVEAIRGAIDAIGSDAALCAALGAAGKRRADDFAPARYQAQVAGVHARLMAMPVARSRTRPSRMPGTQMIGEPL